jgi:16S rRNA (cytosine967-C5)-methyltransferase
MTSRQNQPKRGRPPARAAKRTGSPRRRPLDPARQAAFDVLRAVTERDAYPNLLLPAL